jgi:hypothetical protein
VQNPRPIVPAPISQIRKLGPRRFLISGKIVQMKDHNMALSYAFGAYPFLLCLKVFAACANFLVVCAL